jgi:probable rRNA maturation factor
VSVTVLTGPGLDPGAGLSRREAAALGERVLAALGLPGAGAELLLVDDRRMAGLHRRFMGRPGPTNVLSFPEAEGASGAPPSGSLGQVVLSVDTLLREADLYGQPVAGHAARLLAHAFLHLAGFDHGPEMDALTEQAVQTVREG